MSETREVIGMAYGFLMGNYLEGGPEQITKIAQRKLDEKYPQAYEALVTYEKNFLTVSVKAKDKNDFFVVLSRNLSHRTPEEQIAFNAMLDNW